MVFYDRRALDVDPNNDNTLYPVGWLVTFQRNELSPLLVSLL